MTSNELQRARAQFEYEREHRIRILKSPKGAKRKAAFLEAYSGLAEGIRSGKFLDLESEPQKKAQQKFQLLKRFISRADAVGELGPGDYHLAKIVASQAKSLALVDVVDAGTMKFPKNCRVFVGDGTLMPKSLKNLDVIWSAHVVEHIHPQVLLEHLRSVRESLAIGGEYIIFTPNRFTGPHDISKMFSPIAQGLHLKEYTVTEVRRALLKAKFSSVICYAGGKGKYLRVPIALPLLVEAVFAILPFSLSRLLAKFLPIKALLGIIVIGKR